MIYLLLLKELPYDPAELNDELSTGVYDKKTTTVKESTQVDGSTKALVNWQNKIIQRKKTQGYISS